MARLSSAERNSILAECARRLSARDIAAPFPELDRFGLTKRDIDAADTGFERFQTLHALAGVAAGIVGIATAIGGYLITHPLGEEAAGPNAGKLAYALYGVSTIALFIAAWEIPLSASEDRYWLKRRDDRELIDFYSRWWGLRCEYFAQVEAREQERHRAEQERRQREVAEAAQSERARYAMENIERAFDDLRFARKQRIRQVEPPAAADSKKLASLLAGIGDDVKAAFFDLGSADLDWLLERYKALYGNAAFDYANRTFRAWKSGDVRMSGEVAQRLLALVPQFLDFDARFDLIRKICEQYRPPRRKLYLECTALDWRRHVLPLVNELSIRPHSTFPDDLIDRIEWLIDDDSIAVQKLLVAMDTTEAEIGLKFIEEEFERFDAMLKVMPGKATFAHSIDLPGGSIVVVVRKARPDFLKLAKKLVS